MKVIELITKGYSSDAKYQRDSAWLRNTKNLLIDSVINDYYIPQILIANNEVVDGKQRLLTLKEFYYGEFKWTDPQKEPKIAKGYLDLSPEEKSKFENREIDIKDLGSNLSDSDILEIFVRINEGSIKLNKAERILAKSTPHNRYLVKSIVKESKIKELSDKKKNDRRFKLENLIIRSLTILHMLNSLVINKKDVRGQMELLMKNENIDKDGTLKNNCISTIRLMYQILGVNTIPPKSFNTIFESIFCSFYANLPSEAVILKNSVDVKEKIRQKIDEINSDQMGGGTKFDSIVHIRKRVNKINLILSEYHLDSRRGYTHEQKRQVWNSKEHYCELCGEEIVSIDSFEIDHVEPYAMGGKTILENARILCHSCNNKEGQRTKREIRILKQI